MNKSFLSNLRNATIIALLAVLSISFASCNSGSSDEPLPDPDPVSKTGLANTSWRLVSIGGTDITDEKKLVYYTYNADGSALYTGYDTTSGSWKTYSLTWTSYNLNLLYVYFTVEGYLAYNHYYLQNGYLNLWDGSSQSSIYKFEPYDSVL